jgi:hypothetical protein
MVLKSATFWNITLKVGLGISVDGTVYRLRLPIPNYIMSIVLVSGYQIPDKPFQAEHVCLAIASIQTSTICYPYHPCSNLPQITNNTRSLTILEV